MAWPDGFIWGAGASSVGMEGAHPSADWWRWEHDGRAPESGEGAGLAVDFDADFRMLAAHGFTAVRLMLEWARLEPEGGRHDAEAVERYRTMIEVARSHGLQVWLGLHHYSTPGWFVEAGSWADDGIRGRAWPRHVGFCAEAFGDLAAGWFPIFEPAGYAAAAHLHGALPPGRPDPERFARTVRGLHLAARDAYLELRGGPPVVSAHDLQLVRAGDDSPEARSRARTIERIQWNSWIGALRDGVLAVPGLGEMEVASLADACDIVGFTYRGSIAVGGDGGISAWPPGLRAGPLGETPWAEGLGIVLRRVADELPGRPLAYLSSGLGTPDDNWRTAVLRDELGVVEAAVADGLPVHSWFHQPWIDGYEWGAGFSVPFGLFTRQRRPKDAALLLAETIAAR